jgi:type I restriction enzyme S subunit
MDNAISPFNYSKGKTYENTGLFIIKEANHWIEDAKNRPGGAAYPAVKAIDFKESIVIIPTAKLIEEYDLVFQKSLGISNILQNQNQLLKEARDILLPRLMTGMIDVEELT